MGAGDFRARIEFEKDVGGVDIMQQPIVSWQPFDPPLKRWGKPIISRGRSYWAAWGIAQPITDIVGVYEVPYDKTLYNLLSEDKSKVRARVSGRMLYVEAFSDPAEKRKVIQLIFKESL